MFSVIVPVYNDWSLALKLIDGLLQQNYLDDAFEIIMVDNGSNLIPDANELPPEVTLIKCDIPGSYAARNIGIQHAKGDILAFTDADCLPSQKWLKVAAEWFEINKHREVILAGGVSMFVEDTSVLKPYALYDFALGIPQKRYVKHGYGVTANLFVPRAVFEKVGYFDEKRLSGGDAEFCRRAAKKGGVSIDYLASAEVRHPARCTWEQLSSKARRVKGGQLLNGPLRLRMQYGLRTLLPPIRAWFYALNSSRLKPFQKIQVCMVQLKLWGVELVEMWRLLVLRRSPRR